MVKNTVYTFAQKPLLVINARLPHFKEKLFWSSLYFYQILEVDLISKKEIWSRPKSRKYTCCIVYELQQVKFKYTSRNNLLAFKMPKQGGTSLGCIIIKYLCTIFKKRKKDDSMVHEKKTCFILVIFYHQDRNDEYI